MSKIGFSEGSCPVCDYKESHFKNVPISPEIYGQYLEIDCPRCGNYAFVLDDFDEIKDILAKHINEDELFWFIGYMREQTLIRDINIFNKIRLETGSSKDFEAKFESQRVKPAIKLNKDKIQDYLKYAYEQAPKLPNDKTITLLVNLSRLRPFPGHIYEFKSERDYPIAYAGNAEEFRFYMDYLKSKNLITCKENHCIITIDGWNEINNTMRKNKDLTQCFVAMWFDPSMDGVYLNIEKAIYDAGYKPIRVDKEHYTGDINDKIITEIRKSKFIVADYTNQRHGVYYEAGYAMGLGLPVISTCKKNDINNLHFDTSHLNHIPWETEDELYQMLNDRILALIGEGPFKK